MLWSLLVTLAVGAICGWLASMLMGGKDKSLLMYIILGIVGGAVGNLVFGWIGISFHGFIGNVIGGVLGTCILIAVGRLFFKK